MTFLVERRGELNRSPTFFLNSIVFHLQNHPNVTERVVTLVGGPRYALQFRVADRVMHCSWVVLTLLQVIPMGGVALHEQRGRCSRASECAADNCVRCVRRVRCVRCVWCVRLRPVRPVRQIASDR
eukprot:1874415-Prymnesium_polylepis.1